MDYLVVIEPAADGTYSAFVPDLPGCVSSGKSRKEVKAMIAEAIRGHLDTMREFREPIPAPRATTCLVHAA